MMQPTPIAQETPEPVDTPPYYEVYADRWCIYSGYDWVESINACSDAGRVYGAARVERYVDGHLYARLVVGHQD